MRTLAILFGLCLVCSADVRLDLAYLPADGATVTIHDVGPGFLQVQRSTDLVSWTTFAIASNPYAWTNTWTFNDYLSTVNEAAFYRAIYTYQKPMSPQP